ncbi:MAG: hypothetical protein JW990_19090 [Thermoleophilia bacterium]|nr:hypothetical protein [Thermoleophilia bacterium]
MRVLVGPRTDVGGAGSFDDVELGRALAADVALALAGPGGEVVSLRQSGVGHLSRQLSVAEVALSRAALRAHPCEEAVVGYVCLGVAPGLVAVSDHVNLTWRSPLTGPNDDAIGPRFPSMTGIYAPETVVDRLAAKGIIVVSAVVAGVSDDRHLSAFEAEMVGAEAYQAASSELVPVAIVAAHMGLRLAAVVVPTGS